jgi:2-dehydropantoate 2-reductase
VKNCEILVIGAGAVGVFFHSRLAKANENANVSVIARSDYDHVKAHGYNICSPDGDMHFMPSAVFRNVSDYDRKADFIIVCTKVLPGIDLPELIRPAVSKSTSIVLIQNGINIESGVAAAFPDNELISGIAYVGVARSQAGRIEHTDGGRLKLGVYPQGRSKKLETLAEMYRKSGIPTEIFNDIIRVRWEKLVWNTSYNPVSVLTRSNTAQIMNDPDSEKLIHGIMEEICLIAEAAGWKQRDGIVDEMLAYTRQFRPYKPSMLVDYEQGRKMEIEAIIGNPLRTAQHYGINVPHIQSVYAIIKLLSLSNTKI